MYWHFLRGFNPNTHLVATHGQDANGDVITDIDRFTVTTSKNQHMVSLFPFLDLDGQLGLARVEAVVLVAVVFGRLLFGFELLNLSQDFVEFSKNLSG